MSSHLKLIGGACGQVVDLDLASVGRVHLGIIIIIMIMTIDNDYDDDGHDHDNNDNGKDDLWVHRQLDPVRHPRVLFSIPGGRLVLRPCHLLARLFHPYNPFSSYFPSFLTAVNPIELIVTTCACGAQRSSQGSQLLTVMFGTIRALPTVEEERQR